MPLLLFPLEKDKPKECNWWTPKLVHLQRGDREERAQPHRAFYGSLIHFVAGSAKQSGK